MTGQDFAVVKPDPGFEKNWNILQASVEIAAVLIALAGLIGAFGTGPISSATRSFPGAPISVEFERIARRTAESDMTLRILNPIASPIFELKLSDAFSQHIDVVSTSPRSTSMRAEADGIVYAFDLGASRMGQIMLKTKPRSAGIINATLEAMNARMTLRIYVLP